MPPRLSKRQQREQDEILALGKAPDIEDDGNAKSVSGTVGGFAALFTPGDDNPVESEDDVPSQPVKSKTPKKKKKKSSSAALQLSDAGATGKSSESVPTSRKPQTGDVKQSTPAQKGKGKKKIQEEEDDFDKALAELSLKYPELQKNASSSKSSVVYDNKAITSLLAVSLQHLDSEAEMRKFFGARVVTAAKSGSSGASGSRVRQVAAQKSHLTRPQPTWWSAKQREGLSLRPLTDDELRIKFGDQGKESLDKCWTVEYSKKYKGVTMAFMQAVMAGDPEIFWQLLQTLPWHADTLLQLAEVYRHREEYSQAVDFTERALFTYERAFVGAFSFTSGTNRLDFDHVENRPFFLALHRQMTDLQRRGCVRTAFEFGRLLYALEPWTDPHGALLHLDYLAIKSGMGQWLLDLWDEFNKKPRSKSTGKQHVDPSVLPGWAFARALALRMKEGSRRTENPGSSTDALMQAILSFPSVVPVLADKADISLSAAIRSHQAFRIHPDASSLSTAAEAILHLLSHLYAQRSFSLWKAEEHSTWFASTVAAAMPSITSKKPNALHDRFIKVYESVDLRYSVYRHIMVLESNYKSLFSYIPRDVLNAKQLACDPLPPLTTVNRYDQEFFKGSENVFAPRTRSRRNQVLDQHVLEQVIPDPAVRQQLQAFFDARPGFAEQFPGGLVQMINALGDMDENFLENMMMAEAMGEGGFGPERGMPGQMPGEEDMQVFVDFDQDDVPELEPAVGPPDNRQGANEDAEDRDDDDEDDDEEEDAPPPLPVRVIRNFLNRFWGNTATEVDEDSSEGEEEDGRHIDDSGVD